ncbi:MAG: GIY-YIG nuclease family protein [Thermoguttaceae bacterium]
MFVSLKDHIDKKEFWNEAIVFFSKDDVLNKAHIKYAESCLYRIAKKCGRYKLDNSNEPRQSNLSEADSAEMDEFNHNLQILVNTLGHRIFEEKRKAIHQEKEKNRWFSK